MTHCTNPFAPIPCLVCKQSDKIYSNKGEHNITVLTRVILCDNCDSESTYVFNIIKIPQEKKRYEIARTYTKSIKSSSPKKERQYIPRF